MYKLKATIILVLLCVPVLGNSQTGDDSGAGRAEELLGLADQAWANDDHNTAVDFYQEALNIANALEDKPLIARVSVRLADFISATSYVTYCIRYRQTAADIYRELGDSLAEMDQLLLLGPVFNAQRDYVGAEKVFSRSLQLARGLKTQTSEYVALSGLAVAVAGTGDTDAARSLFGEALAYHRAENDSSQVAEMLLGLAGLETGTEGLSRSSDMRREAALIYQRLGLRQKEASALLDLGLLWQAGGQYDSSLVYLGQSRTIFRALENRVSEITILAYQSVALHMRGDSSATRDSLGTVREMIEGSADAYRRAWGAYFVATQLKTVEAFDLAAGFFSLAVAGYRDNDGDRRGEALCLAEQGLCYVETDRIDSALVLLNEALVLNRDMGESVQETMTLEYIGLAHSRSGDIDSALDNLRQAREIHRETGAFTLEAANLLTTGNVQVEHGLYSEAVASYHAALDLHERFDHPVGRVSLLGALAEVSVAAGELDQAEQYCQKALDLIDSNRFLRYRKEITNLLAKIRLLKNDPGGE